MIFNLGGGGEGQGYGKLNCSCACILPFLNIAVVSFVLLFVHNIFQEEKKHPRYYVRLFQMP